ncbi:MAG: hypothetical protein Q8M03_03015 [Legionella sp.]|nr:hypothetical protein [Legionella sp.]
MSYKIFSLITLLCFFIFKAQAICVKNETEFSLYYEIENKNYYPAPKVKFHSGIVLGNQQKCHAHSKADSDDWMLYRHDFIKIFKIDEQSGQERVCARKVDGIMNTLEVSYQPQANKWWCLDRSDYED